MSAVGVPIVLPELGGQVRFSLWFARIGDAVFQGDRIAEVIIGEATFDVAAPINGRLSDQLVFAGDGLESLQVLGTVDAMDDERRTD